MRNVVKNCPSPMSNPTLMFPQTRIAIKSCANAPSSTYVAYQSRKKAVIGKTKPDSLRLSSANSGLAWAARNCSPDGTGASFGEKSVADNSDSFDGETAMEKAY